MEEMNGRIINGRDPFAAQVRALRDERRAAGLPYPSRTVDDFYAEPFVFWGPTAYSTTDLAILRPSSKQAGRPVDLPPGFLIDGEARLPRETKTNYARYLVYRDLGTGRSLRAVARAMGLSFSGQNYSMVASRFRWAERVAAWDSKIETEVRENAQQLVQKQMAVEVQRRATYLENEWTVVERGFEIVNEMLKYPVVEKKSERTDEKGMTHITIWQPGKWTYSAMAQLIEALTKIGRLNSGLSTSNTSQKSEDLTDRSGGPDMPMNAEDEAMHRYASQKAEEAYFAACDEWKSRQQAPLRALVVA